MGHQYYDVFFLVSITFSEFSVIFTIRYNYDHCSSFLMISVIKQILSSIYYDLVTISYNNTMLRE